MDNFVRDEKNKIIFGICAGISNYLGISTTFVRLAFLLLIPASGMGILLYLLLMVLMPANNQPKQEPAQAIQSNINNLTKSITKNIDELSDHPRNSMIAGLSLVTAGGLFLLSNLGWGTINFIWPVVMLGLGLYILQKRRKNKN